MTTLDTLRATYQRQTTMPFHLIPLFDDLLAYLSARAARVAALEAPRTPAPACDVCHNCQGFGVVSDSNGWQIDCPYCGGTGVGPYCGGTGVEGGQR